MAKTKNSTIALVGAYTLTSFTILAVVVLLLLGDDDVREMVRNGLVAIGGSVGSVFLAWLSSRLLRDENRNGIPDDFEGDDEEKGDDE